MLKIHHKNRPWQFGQFLMLMLLLLAAVVILLPLVIVLPDFFGVRYSKNCQQSVANDTNLQF